MAIYRLMGMDYGEKRIGIALSDPMRIISKPYKVLVNDESFFQNLEQIIKEENVGEIILGLPINIAGDDTKKTLEVRNFKIKIEEKINLEVTFWDERYTSTEANELLKKMGYSPQEGRKVIDKIAASLILKDFMENN